MKKYLTTVTTILHYLFYSLFLLTPLIMNSKTSEIFEFNKMMLIYSIVVLISIFWAIDYLLNKRRSIYKPYYLLLLLIFLITQLISAYVSIDPHTSIFGYYGRWNGGVLSIIAYIILFFVFVQLFTKKTISRFLSITLFSSFIVILWGLLAKYDMDFSCLLFTGNLTNACWTDQFKPAERMFATIGQPNWLGAYLCINFFIGLYFLMKEYWNEERQWLKVASYGIYVVLNVLCIYFTKSRSALLALGIATMAGGVLILARRVRPLYSALFLILIVSGLLIFSPQSIIKQFQTPAPDNLNVTESFDIRKIVWQGAIDLGLRYPYFGTGVETFAYSYYFTRPAEHNRTSEWDFIYNKAHNEYLNYFATTGFVGLASYLSLILSTVIIFYITYKKWLKKDAGNIWTSPSFYLFLSYITILVTNFFGFSTSTSQIFFYTIPAILLIDGGSNKKEESTEIPAQKSSSSIVIIAICSVILVGVWGLIYIFRYYNADLKYNQAKGYIAASEYGNAMIDLHDALKLKNEHVYEDKLSSTLAYLAFQSSFDDKKQSADFIELSKYSNYKSLTAAPYNMLYWKTQARNYYLYYQVTHNVEDLKTGIKAMERAQELAPTDVQTMYALAVLYVSAGQEDTKASEQWKHKARTTLVEIFKLKPDYREAQQLGGEI
ncbi:hypothetical protein BH09PAT2_BH09PAT2_09910 [soil metagenome]